MHKMPGLETVVADYGVSIEIGNVPIAPGDLIVGDRDGVVVVPVDVEAEVIGRAREKVATENKVLEAINDGMTATNAFDEFGVL